MSGRLTTHVLDLSQGIPAAGMTLQLWRIEDGTSRLLREDVTNSDGRLDQPLLEGAEFIPGSYELLFRAGDYFRGSPGTAAGIDHGAAGLLESAPLFLDEIPIRFYITDPEGHYHVPLLAAPGGYSTYRGS